MRMIQIPKSISNSIRIKKEVENVQIPPTLLHTKVYYPIARILKPKKNQQSHTLLFYISLVHF